MKKILTLISVITIVSLVFVACTGNANTNNTNDDVMMTDNDNTSKNMDNDNMMKDDDKMTNDGPMAEDFTLRDLDGNLVRLSSFDDQKVYLKFWASWCSICLAGLDDVEALSSENNIFKVLTIVTPNYKGEKSSEDFIKWFKSLDVENITVLLDEDGVVAKEFQVRGYPTSVYIGSDGVIVKNVPGHANNDFIIETFTNIY